MSEVIKKETRVAYGETLVELGAEDIDKIILKIKINMQKN